METVIEEFEREALYLSTLSARSSTILRYCFHQQKNRKIYLFMEYAEPLYEVITHQRDTKKPLEVADMITYLTGLVEGILFLHAQDPPVIHRDIKVCAFKFAILI